MSIASLNVPRSSARGSSRSKPDDEGRLGVSGRAMYTAAPVLGAEAEALRSIDTAAMLGHELRNPVSAIGAGIELLKSGALQRERNAGTLEMMQRQVGQIARLLDDLSAGARLTDGGLEIERERLDLTQVALDALDTMGGLIEGGGHELSIALPGAGTVWVRGDRGRLIEVIANLLSNAAKYTPSGGRIALKVSADAETASIRIEDTGIGIAADFMPRIFDLFTQGRQVLNCADRGLGFGLPLVRNFVHLHGGEVSVLSAGEGKGSEFEVRLPRSPPPERLHRPAAKI